jgi:uncharacterized protein YndB with AHSA1/START domain
VSRRVAASPEDVWELLTSTRTWTQWGPSVTAVDPVDTVLSQGLHGRVRTPLGLWLPFRVTHFEPHQSWAWSVLGFPATSHRIDSVPGGCRVTFGVSVLAIPYLLICRLALRRIASFLEANAGGAISPPGPQT